MKITNTYEYQKLRGLKRKIQIVEMLGGKCENCGYNKNIAAFDFHHVNPKEKDYQLDMRKLSNTRFDKLLEEVKKCKLLCSNCHREFHSPDLELTLAKEMVKKIDESVINAKHIGRPKCTDCDCEINYTHTRCKDCNYKFRRKVDRPKLEVLLLEIKNKSQQWCADKYGVSRSTIRRWIGEKV
jgi:hypothetical protein